MQEETAEEEEEEELHHHRAVAPLDHQDLPIMHWEDLTQRIAELEKQEQERREGRGTTAACRGGEWRHLWDEEDVRRCRVSVAASRCHRHRNLQLCFVNDSDSEDEGGGVHRKVAMGTDHNGRHAAGLKQEVAATLRALRDKVLAEQKEKERTLPSCAPRKHLQRRELQQRSALQLGSLRKQLQQDVHALSAELVTHLLVRDHLRTKQDAMLLDVQDLT